MAYDSTVEENINRIPPAKELRRWHLKIRPSFWYGSGSLFSYGRGSISGGILYHKELLFASNGSISGGSLQRQEPLFGVLLSCGLIRAFFMKIFIVAGEESGDSHGAALIRELVKLRPGIQIEGLGGEQMERAGCRLRRNLVELAAMWLKSIMRAPTFLRILKDTARYLEASPPDLLVLIDYPGFNMKLADKAKRAGIPVLYYVSPQVWAWWSSRVYKIARMVDKMLVLFPFEVEIYERVGLPVECVGHPLFDYLREGELNPGFDEELGLKPGERLIGLLPGSRAQEIRKVLPIMLGSARILSERHPDLRFAIPCAKQKFLGRVKDMVERSGLPVKVFLGHAREVMARSHTALVTSGTATLELLYYETPMVILYRTSLLEYLLSTAFKNVPFIGLVNILWHGEVVPEFLSWRNVKDVVAARAFELIEEGETRRHCLAELKGLKRRIEYPGASRRAALRVLELLDTRTTQAGSQIKEGDST
jgi:lipid-A-disaccharide synthase